MHRQYLVDADDARGLRSDPRDCRPCLRLGSLAGQQTLAFIGQKRCGNDEDAADDQRGDPVEDRQAQHIGQRDAGERRDEAEQGRRILEQHREDGRVLAAPGRGKPAPPALGSAKLTKGDDPGADLEQHRDAKHDVIDIHMLDPVRVAQLVQALDERDHRAKAEDHHGDDKRPEIQLEAVAERMLRVGRAPRPTQSVKQQQLVSGIDGRVNGFAQHCRAAGHPGSDILRDGDRQIARQRGEDGPDRRSVRVHCRC